MENPIRKLELIHINAPNWEKKIEIVNPERELNFIYPELNSEEDNLLKYLDEIRWVSGTEISTGSDNEYTDIHTITAIRELGEESLCSTDYLSSLESRLSGFAEGYFPKSVRGKGDELNVSQRTCAESDINISVFKKDDNRLLMGCQKSKYEYKAGRSYPTDIGNLINENYWWRSHERILILKGIKKN